jgi:uncharacterized membrane protein
MTLTTTAAFGDDRTSRWIMLISLGFNLFFVGAAGAFAVRHYVADRPGAAAPVDRSVAARLERLASTLPARDGEILRGEQRANAASLENSREAYRRAQDEVRAILRSEPFQPDAMRAAMVETRRARQGFDQLLQDIIAAAAARMSPEGRSKLADWPSGPRGAREASR